MPESASLHHLGDGLGGRGAGWRESGRVEVGGVFPASYFCTECEVLGQLSAGESKQNAVDNYNDASLVFRFC